MRRVACALASALALTAAPPAAGYSDRAGTDVVMDAPWRTVRDTIPVLFFFPEFARGRRVERIRIVECDAGAPLAPPVLVDDAGGPDTLNGATFVGPLGEPRAGLGADERVTSFWHYVVRIPHAALARHGLPDVHELRAEVEWTRPGVLGRTRFVSRRTLRVLVDPARFPTLGPGDRSYDTHVHTIAEQTAAGPLGADAAHKAFGGPLVMLVESAWALGLVETRPREGGWSDLADSLAITDHNLFYSGAPYDRASAPRFGPTAATDGRAGEAAWHRAHLGRLAGEEITLRRGSRQDGSPAPNLGHHLLAYGTRHFEGPWHGGYFLTSRRENPNTLDAVLAGMRAAGPGGFAFAAHPRLAGFEWPPEYDARGIGFPPFNARAGLVDSSGTEFLYRGAEVWNTKIDRVARASGRLAASSAFDEMDPFPGGPEAQRFEPAAWDGELAASLDTLLAQIGRALRFSFAESPREKFVRKLYMIAGSDAHGDFNYADEVTAAIVPWSGLLHDNAFARVRTLALAHDDGAGSTSAPEALRHGRAVLTDGPVFEYQLDADGRHDPAAGAARWHDGAVRWENADGAIGGAGALDGARTMLVPLPGAEVWMRSRWLRSVTPGAGALERFRFDRVTTGARDTFEVAAGAEGALETRPLPRAMDDLAALVASARDPSIDERCIANPVWVAPVRIDVDTPAGAHPPEAALPAGSLRVTFHFPLSMGADARTRAFLRPLDGKGNSTDPAIELAPAPGWEEAGGVAAARYTVVNAADVPDPPQGWDAESHAPDAGARSFVVYLEGPVDVHGNRLNDIGRAFTIRCPGSPPGAPSRLPGPRPPTWRNPCAP